MGIDPYPAAEFPVTAWSTDIINEFEDLPVIGKDETRKQSYGKHCRTYHEQERHGKSCLCKVAGL